MFALYRKYRPQKLSEVAGQEHIKNALLGMLKTGRISHAYLFTGPRGIGKTSIARILAKAVNCEEAKGGKYQEPCDKCETCISIRDGRSLDLIEIDAASNRGIDDIRDLREKIKLAPTSNRFKVYIIDEVHMLTTEAFNALLKTLEEPPSHAIFILATTEPQKLPQTIISRCQRFDFKKPNMEEIVKLLENLCIKEEVTIDKEGLKLIAKASEGAFRDAVGILDKIIAALHRKETIKAVDIMPLLGLSEKSKVLDFLSLLFARDTKKSILWLNDYIEEGGSPHTLVKTIIETLREMMLSLVGLGNDKEIIEFSGNIPAAEITKLIHLFAQAEDEFRSIPIPQLPLELAIVEFTKPQSSTDGGKQPPKNGENKKEQEKEVEEVKEEAEEELKEEPKIPLISLEEIHNKWKEFLEKMKPLNHSIELLLKSCKIINFQDGFLTLETNYKFHKELLEGSKIRNSIERTAKEVYNVPIRIRCTVNSKPIAKKETENFNIVDPDEEIINISKEIFKAEVID